MASWWAGLAAGLTVTAALWALRRRTRGPLAAWLLFVGSLFCVLGFFNVYGFLFSQVAGHFQYLGCLTFAGAAVAHCGAALRIKSRLAWVHRNLALQLARLPDRPDEAVAHCEAALRLQPDSVDAHNPLAIL